MLAPLFIVIVPEEALKLPLDTERTPPTEKLDAVVTVPLIVSPEI